MKSVVRFIASKLKLKVNEQKSAGWPRNWPATYGVESATSATAKHQACCSASRSGPDAGCGRRFGSSGNAGGQDSQNCRNEEWARLSPLKRRAAPMVRGSWQTVRPLPSRCPTPILPRLAFLR